MENFNQFSFKENEFVDFDCQNVDVLTKYIKQLDKCFKKESDNFAEICFVVYKIKELFDNYKQVYSKRNNNLNYSFDSIMLGFGISNTESSRLLSCYEKFCCLSCSDLDIAKCSIIEEFKGFSKSKLFELLNVDNERIVSDLRDNVLRFDFTVKQVREYVKNLSKLNNELISANVVEGTSDFDIENIPPAYDPKQHYDFNYFEEKTKSQLLNIVWDLQKEYEKLKLELNKLKKEKTKNGK